MSNDCFNAFNVQLFDDFVLPVYAKTICGKYCYFNKAILEFYGEGVKGMIGKNVFQCGFPEDLAELYYRQDMKVFSGKEDPQIYEGDVPLKEGIVLCTHVKHPVRKDGEIIALLGMVVDNRKWSVIDLQNELDKAREIVEQIWT